MSRSWQREEALEALRRYWEVQPNLRLGQILTNAAWFAAPGVDLFFVEDEVITGGLQQLYLLDPTADRSASDSGYED